MIITRNVLAENAALGKTAARVYDFLLAIAKPLSAAEIAQALNLSIHQVYRALSSQKLQKYDLVQKTAHGWQAIAIVPLELERAGRLADAKRRARHIIERQTRAASHIINFREKHDSTFSLLSYDELKGVGD